MAKKKAAAKATTKKAPKRSPSKAADAEPAKRAEAAPKKAPKRAEAAPKKAPKRAEATDRRCGLCGRTSNLTRTDCCGNWICDDEDNYVMFSYARNSCHRNHGRYTLCAGHFNEGHEGRWQDCAKCRGMFETEMYVYFGTNEYNFETLQDPPAFEPTRCRKCGAVIRLGEDGYTQSREGYTCWDCSDVRF